MSTVKISLRLEGRVAQRINEAAADQHRSVSNMINVLLLEGLRRMDTMNSSLKPLHKNTNTSESRPAQVNQYSVDMDGKPLAPGDWVCTPYGDGPITCIDGSGIIVTLGDSDVAFGSTDLAKLTGPWRAKALAGSPPQEGPK